MVEVEGSTDAETLTACAEADAILIFATYLPAPVIRGLNRCRIISRLGTGVDKIQTS